MSCLLIVGQLNAVDPRIGAVPALVGIEHGLALLALVGWAFVSDSPGWVRTARARRDWRVEKAAERASG